LLTTKKVNFEAIAHELIWFLRGETNIKYLVDNKVPIWNDNAFDYNLEKMVNEGVFSKIFGKRSADWFSAKKEYINKIKEDLEFAKKWGDLGPVYGSEWIHWPKFIPVEVDIGGKEKQFYIKDPKGINQISDTLAALKKNPTAKRHVISAWNPNEILNMALPPCHTLFHINANEGKMDLQLYQRSCDMFLGVPFNLASYSMLTQIIAQQAELEPRRFIHTFGDVHFYCGDGERGIWYKENLKKLKKKILGIKNSILVNPEMGYSEILSWINKNAPPEPVGSEGQDHVTAILKQLTRIPKKLPTLKISNKEYNKLTIDDFTLENYEHDPFIKRAMAV